MRAMRKIMGAGRILLVLLSCVTCTAAYSQDGSEGRKLAEKNCSRCHAVGETGASPHTQAPPFRVIAAKGHVDNLQEALAEGIMVGHADMPEFVLEPDQIEDFLTFLKTLAPAAN